MRMRRVLIKHIRLNAVLFGTQHLTTTMFSFLVTSCFTLVAAQLELSQHTALMDLYNALGANSQTTRKRKTSQTFLLFRLFHCSVPALRGNYTVP
jgi:hypothetical protein